MAQAPSPLFYISFGSGSSGNCCYLGTRNAGILIDAGILTETVVDTLKENGIKMENIVGICLTHDHGDHVKYAYNIVRKHKHMKVYCTNRVVNGMLRKHNISKRIKDYHSPIFKEIPFKLGDFEITAFDVPHDGDDNMGFFVRHGDKNFVVATDLGAISERARHYISQAHYLMIEANYDKEMLIKGTYPDYLKRRIQTDRGHMDNVETAAFLSEIYTPQLKYIFLCHLSNDNNTPEIALNTISKALKDRGLTIGTAQETIEDRKADVQLMALPRLEPTRWFVFK
ncbi:MAG: MBL fold metallo-hydrolase [Muribaculaceae bacterium]|nr:MBL fold metallo-hydrolase [Muribaculaceae bacterium]MBQ2370351.1 MBL fold metallo-hydrolase [Muribaculaceae bacterium]MBQ2399288.1 MBL fold metallo-hydrolase [Muribaculaceae bacterium]MBQ2439721.1 MBL fold metallo-hydrolase [Muribaculaceae bacterium]MBQ5724108.1 MBL fold metallo-hydrolase [Muribaculaceae bacterium]